MANKDVFTFYNGVTIPPSVSGHGKSLTKKPTQPVTMALKNGYTHIDTAHAYHNEENVGKAIRDFGIAREEVSVTSKSPCASKRFRRRLAALRRNHE